MHVEEVPIKQSSAKLLLVLWWGHIWVCTCTSTRLQNYYYGVRTPYILHFLLPTAPPPETRYL